MKNFREKCCSIIMLIIGLISLAIGIVIVALMPMLTKTLVNQQVPIAQNSFVERIWQDPPFAITMQFHLFNVTNPYEVIHKGAKPALVQKGPYAYKESQNKKQVTYDLDNSISYVNQKIYKFDSSLSCATCRENDIFTLPNVPYLAAVPIIDQLSQSGQIPKGLGPLIKVGGKVALMGIGEQMFKSNITAAQFLFDGYSDTIFELLGKVQPGRAPDRMGLFYGKNNTDDGVYVIKSGVGNTADMGSIITWNGHTDLSFTNWWNSTDPKSPANQILGGDGTIYPPFVKRSDTLYTYVSDICRSISMSYSADVNVQGIPAYRFRIDEDNFNDNLTENNDFCWPMPKKIYSGDIQRMKDGGYCLPSGMNDISKCQYDSPIVTSMPHFMFAPDEVKRSVDGLSPESQNYLSYVDLEPTSGVLLSGARIIQLNVIMQTDSSDLLTKNMIPVIVPLAWLNESVVIDQGTHDYVYQNVVIIRETAYVVAYVAMSFGALWIVLVAVGWAVSAYNTKRQRSQFLKLT